MEDIINIQITPAQAKWITAMLQDFTDSGNYPDDEGYYSLYTGDKIKVEEHESLTSFFDKLT